MGNKVSTKVISELNHKGGVGKTTSVVTISSLLGLVGYKVLVIDNDCSTNTTLTFHLYGDNYEDKSIVDLFHLDSPTKESVSEIIRQTAYKGIDIIESRKEHEHTAVYLANETNRRVVQKILHKALKLVKGDYDFVFIDTHPDMAMPNINALCASDYVLIPCSAADGYSFQGTPTVVSKIRDISDDEDLNPNLRLLGVHLTNCNPRTQDYKDYKELYETTFGDCFIDSPIRTDSAFAKATTFSKPLPYLLGDVDFRSSSKWKGIYDYILLLRNLNFISENETTALIVAYKVLEGEWLLLCREVNKNSEEKEHYECFGIQSTADDEPLNGYCEIADSDEAVLTESINIIKTCSDPNKRIAVCAKGSKCRTIIDSINIKNSIRR